MLDDGDRLLSAVQVLGLVLAPAALLLLRHTRPRSPRPPFEEQIWPRLLLGAGVLSAAVLIAQVLTLVAGPGAAWAASAGGLLYGAADVLAAVFFYQGLIRWNRAKSLGAEPDDWLNGVGAVLALVSIGNAFLPDAADTGELISVLQHQATLIAFGVGFVMVGTACSVTAIGGLARDRRMWLVCAAMLILFAPVLAGLFSPLLRAVPTQVVAMVAVALILVAARMESPAGSTPAPANTSATTNGALVVVTASVGMLVVAGFSASAELLPTAFAAAAVLVVSVHLYRMVRSLAQLTVSRQLALTDELTGIANRRALLAELERALGQDERITLMIIDLDDFKLINDRYGHGVGDELLRAVAAEFGGQLPTGAMLARLGGDEFAVLLPEVPDAAGLETGRRLVESAAPQRDVEGHPLRVRASVGVASGGGMAPTELMRRADAAMYRAKSTRAGVSVFDRELDGRAREQLALLEELRIVLEPGSPDAEQLTVVFQPQLDLGTGQAVGAETLVRWQHPRLGLLTPDRFLDLVEADGLMNELTARVLDLAVQQWHRFRAAGTPLRVSVNLSTSCLAQPGLLVLLDDVLARGVDPGEFVLEITETSVMADPDLALGTMRAIAARGFRISIDDYGTGYSSLAYLNDLPAVELKIDRSFVTRLLADERTTAIVAGTVDLAHRLGMKLVAEGVEDADTLGLLRDLGCDESQGYLHGRPMPAADLIDWLAGTRPVDAGRS